MSVPGNSRHNSPPVTYKNAEKTAVGKGGGEPVRDELEGTLYKWTNYIKGYQKRWVVLKAGRLAYYRNQGEVGQSCRGNINLSGASVLRSEESSTAFAVTHATQTFHLKAKDDADRHRWIAAIELSKIRALQNADSDEEEALADEHGSEGSGDGGRADVHSALAGLGARISDLNTCQALIEKHGASLLRCLADVDKAAGDGGRKDAADMVQERTTLFRITANAMINAAKEFSTSAESQGRRWEKALAHERGQRQQLQEQLVSLAKMHAALERATIKKMQGTDPAGGGAKVPMQGGPYSDSDEDETLYQDAVEEVDELYNLTSHDRTRTVLKRTGSEMSGTEEPDEEEFRERRKATELLGAKIVSNTKAKPTEQTRPVRAESKSARVRRSEIPPRPNVGLSLWSVMKNSIGKELSKIPMPVNFNEPLSMVQRLTEDMEYSYLLDAAAKCTDSCEQMAYVAVFTASAYGTLTNRTGKPFNPLLGETYECDRRDDYGWRVCCEQVSHHPPAAAQFVEGSAGWEMYQEFTMSSKFRGKYLSVIPLGMSHLEFLASKHHYTWRKVTTTVHNIIVGKLWIDNHGEMTIENHTTGDKCHLKYIPYSYFSRDTPRKVSDEAEKVATDMGHGFQVTGIVTDKSGRVQWVVQGTWDQSLEIARVLNPTDASANTGDKPVFTTDTPKTVWRKTPPIPNCEAMYNFTRLALELNEQEPGVAPTDSRNRPDQRLMETGEWDESNKEKLRLEEKQRAVRRRREAEAEQAMMQGKAYEEYVPIWFKKERDPYTGNLIHHFTREYWTAKENQAWAKCPDIY